MRKLLYLAAMVLCIACDNEDDWKPGDPVSGKNPIAYFSYNNAAVIGHTEGNTSFFLTMERTNTDGELILPIVVVDSVGSMSVPKSVTFADGEDQARLYITYTYRPGMRLSLSLGKGYGNPYLEQDGTVNYRCNVARLVPLCKVKYRSTSTLDAVNSYIYYYEGMNRFRYTNFMDSGVDVDFTVDTKHTGIKFNADDVKSLKGDFVPLNNKYDYGDMWYLYDDNNDEYPQWNVTGWNADQTVYYYLFYAYSDEYTYSYSQIDFTNKTYSYFFGSIFYLDEDMVDKTSPNIQYTLDYKNLPSEEETQEETK